MSSADPATLDPCGCCEGTPLLTPADVSNPPGLSVLVYRAGTQGAFKQSMLSRIAGHSALGLLTTRDDDDPTVAVMDAWATVLDVLTFYQERIANEGYLRTATERLSILELAESIGYRLNPGVAAGTFLAFTLENAVGSVPTLQIDEGLKVQSTPKQNQLPQTFETVEALQIFNTWNALAARQTQPLLPYLGQTVLYILGIDNDLKKGDAILIVGDERKDPSSPVWDFRRVLSATMDAPSNRTVVTLESPLGDASSGRAPAAVNPRIYVFRQRANLFGYNAPDWRAMPDNIQAKYLGLPSTSTPPSSYTDWPGFDLADISDPPAPSASGNGLLGVYYNDATFTTRALVRIDPQINFDWSQYKPDPAITGSSFSVQWSGWLAIPTTGYWEFVFPSALGIRLWIDNSLVLDTIDKLTGSSSTRYLTGGVRHNLRIDYLHNPGDPRIQFEWAGLGAGYQGTGTLAPGSAPTLVPMANLFARDIFTVHLDAAYPKILAGSWVVLSTSGAQELYSITSSAEDSRTGFTLTSKTQRLTLSGVNLNLDFNEQIRQTMVFAQSEPMQFAESPIQEPVSGSVIDLDRVVTPFLPPGRLVAITGLSAADGSPVSEVATIQSTEDSAVTSITLTSALQNTYQRASVSINANLVRATHGETKTEILGSGDGSVPSQRFTLQQKPLTWTSAVTASGAVTTLQIRVNDLLWTEVPTFFGVAPDARVYTTRTADDGTVTVEFGDGINGARLPTGSNNVTATYRVGIGLSGMVDAGQINLLMSRPLGLKGVTNPLAPSGAADPEVRDEARRNAPLTVLTLDRIVSVRDYEDFARAFAGIGKAKATALWLGEHRIVHITVASSAGGAVDPASDLYNHLHAAVDLVRDPSGQVVIASFDPRLFDVSAQILVDTPTYLVSDVFAAVSAALQNTFSFSQRDFAQSVAESEVIAVIQRTPGVVAVNLTNLDFTPSAWYYERKRVPGFGVVMRPGRPAGFPFREPVVRPVLASLPARTSGLGGSIDSISPAQLLTINPSGIQLSEMKQP